MEATWKSRELTLSGKGVVSAKDVHLKSTAGNLVDLETVPDPSTNERLVARLPCTFPPDDMRFVDVPGQPKAVRHSAGTRVRVFR